jgi:signal transduction histidine kinase/CheY-like chemotaxis protein
MKKKADGAKLYKHESELLANVNEVANNNILSKEELLNEYLKLGKEYDKLLRQTIKITRIGDFNQRKLENQRALLKEKSDKLKEIAEIKSRFFANISHEFRTPLTLIVGPLEQMLSQCRDLKQKRTLTLMLRNAQRLLSLINQLLELSKFESGQVRLRASQQNIVTFLKGIVSSFELLANQNEVDLTVYAEKENIPLYFEPEKLEEVMCNLLINALKFTPQGGKISLSIRGFPPGSGEMVEIAVCDTGPGIPRDQMSSIFDRFYQLDSTFEHHKKGFGIGLALVREFILLHHGEIDVNSREGEGTEFVIHLPMGKAHLSPGEIVTQRASSSQPHQRVKDYREIARHYASILELDKEQPEPASEPEPAGVYPIDPAKVKQDIVLVVEDSADMRQYIREALEPRYNVVEAANGREGIRMAKEIIPDIIISDIVMPEVDGNELCRMLKSDIKTSHVPLILLSVKSLDRDVIKGLQAGADDYITKPFSTKILCTRIKNLIDLRRQLHLKIKREMTLQPVEISVSSMDQDFLSDLQCLIEKNISDPGFSVDQLAKNMVMSQSTLYRKVQALTGETPIEFLRSYRLKRAAQLLKDKFGNVTEVAFEVGFSSTAYFTKCFKKKFHQLPSAFQLTEGLQSINH